jgi:hypothetical protein
MEKKHEKFKIKLRVRYRVIKMEVEDVIILLKKQKLNKVQSLTNLHKNFSSTIFLLSQPKKTQKITQVLLIITMFFYNQARSYHCLISIKSLKKYWFLVPSLEI